MEKTGSMRDLPRRTELGREPTAQSTTNLKVYLHRPAPITIIDPVSSILRSQPTLRFKMEKVLFLLGMVVALCCAAKHRREHSDWDYKSEAEKVNLKGCANLTTVLDNWKFAIMTQFKNLLLYDHHMVLPDYGRIKSLSEALDDLYKEFNHLKERLGELTTKFDGVEAFVDEMKAGRYQRPPSKFIQLQAERASNLPMSPAKRRVLVRKSKKPSESQAAESP